MGAMGPDLSVRRMTDRVVPSLGRGRAAIRTNPFLRVEARHTHRQTTDDATQARRHLTANALADEATPSHETETKKAKVQSA
jgi:hypothetical protein